MPPKSPPKSPPKPEPPQPSPWPPIAIALIAFALVCCELDPTGTYSWMPDGPGLTVDEVLNVQPGVRTEIGIRYWLLGSFTLREVFGDAELLGPDPPLGYHATDYPPLGRYLIGVAHNLVTTFAYPPHWETPFVVAAARIASALAFAITIGLIARFALREWGLAAAVIAPLSLVGMPRVFSHAHLASLETMMGLFFTWTTLAIANRWLPPQHITNRATLIAGGLWGLALLVKMQAIFIPLPVTVWAFYHWRWQAFRPLALMAITGLATFFIGWPWLWFDPVNHAWEYFAQTTDRATLPVWYLGQHWKDINTPWHYPWVMTFATVPLIYLALAAWGLWKSPATSWKNPKCQLILLVALTPLVVFSIPGVALYDGVRLFLISFPLLALSIGHGGHLAFDQIKHSTYKNAFQIVLGIIICIPLVNLYLNSPTYLAAYSLSIGSGRGAERLGMEGDYWGTAWTPELLNQVANEIPEGGTLAVMPILHPFQLDDLRTQTPAFRQRKLQLVEAATPAAQAADGLLILNRKASLSEAIQHKLSAATPRLAVRRQGRILAAYYDASTLADLNTPEDSTP